MDFIKRILRLGAEICEKRIKMASLSAISLFSGAGGMDLGFHEAGFSILWANDFDKAACETYRLNLTRVISEGPIQAFLDQMGSLAGVDLVFGGPPCQGFSVAGKMDPDDARSQLIWRYFDVVEKTAPRLFVLENVKALAALDKWGRVRRRMFERGSGLGYQMHLIVLRSQDFGVPQKRERMFLFGMRGGDPRVIPLLLKKYVKPAPTVRQLFSELGRAGSATNARTCRARVTIAANPVLRRSPYAGMLFNGQGRPINPDDHSATLHASMGGNKTPIIDEEHLHGGGPSWVEWYHAHLLSGGKPLGFNDAPESLRRLTLDEAIRIQTFPSDYLFSGGQSRAFAQIGNAVPPQLSRAVAGAAFDLLSISSKEASVLVRQTGIQLDLQLEAG